MAQRLVPVSEGSPAAWTPVGAATAWECLDDGVDSHDGGATYIKTDGTSVPVRHRVGIATGTDPLVHTWHVLRMEYRRATATTSGPIGIRLFQGAVGITAVRRVSAMPSSWSTFEYTLSEAEAAAITDYGDLYIQVNGPALAFAPGAYEARVTAAELRIPDFNGGAVAWTLAEGASDAVASALASGMSAKLTALNTEYGDSLLTDIAGTYRSPMAVDDGVHSWPALAIYSPAGSLPVINAGGHVDGTFTVTVKVLARHQDKATLQQLTYRYGRAVFEVVTEAWAASTLDGWDWTGEAVPIEYGQSLTDGEWSSEVTLSFELTQIEAKS